MPEAQIKSAACLKMISPEFVMPDVTAAAEYYRDVFGFKILSYFLNPPVYAMVERDTDEIHSRKADAGAAPAPNVTRGVIALDAYHLDERSCCPLRQAPIASIRCSGLTFSYGARAELPTSRLC
jgi:hypothetical protein